MYGDPRPEGASPALRMPPLRRGLVHPERLGSGDGIALFCLAILKGHLDPEVATDVLIKEELEDPTASIPAPASEVCFIEKDDWWIAWEIAGPHDSRRFILSRGPNKKVPLEILEFVMAKVKAEDMQAAEASQKEREELDFSAFDMYPFPTEPPSSQAGGGDSIFDRRSSRWGYPRRHSVRRYMSQSSRSQGTSRRHGDSAPSTSRSAPGRRNRLARLLGMDSMYGS